MTEALLKCPECGKEVLAFVLDSFLGPALDLPESCLDCGVTFNKKQTQILTREAMEAHRNTHMILTGEPK